MNDRRSLFKNCYLTLKPESSCPVPVNVSVSIKQFENGLAVHVCRNVLSGDVQDGGGQVNVQHDVGVAEKIHTCCKRITTCSVEAEKKQIILK